MCILDLRKLEAFAFSKYSHCEKGYYYARMVIDSFNKIRPTILRTKFL